MAGKRIVKLVDRRAVNGTVTQVLRKVLRQIEAGDVTGFAIATINRDGSVYNYSQSEDPIKTLGAIDLLREHTLRRELVITSN